MLLCGRGLRLNVAVLRLSVHHHGGSRPSRLVNYLDLNGCGLRVVHSCGSVDRLSPWLLIRGGLHGQRVLMDDHRVESCGDEGVGGRVEGLNLLSGRLGNTHCRRSGVLSLIGQSVVCAKLP